MASVKINQLTPLLPLRDVVVYPQLVIPLFVGREKSIKAIETANAGDKQILLVAQKSANTDDPSVKDLFNVGTLATILQMLKLPDGTVKVLVEGLERIEITEFNEKGDFWSAAVKIIKIKEAKDKKSVALKRTVYSQFDQYVKLNKKIPPELLTTLSGIEDPGRMADSIAANLNLKLSDKQKLLECINVTDRLEMLMDLLEGELDILQVEKRIRGRVKRQMEKSQREYYLNEQVKAIQKELGEQDEAAEFEELEKKIIEASMSKEAEDKCLGELKKLKMMSPMSAEASVVRTYIETIISLPWKNKTDVNLNLKNAEKILNNDHHGLEKVKERIIEYLAVQQRVDKVKSPILCLVGPPGVGKTSLGQSIAKSINRKFVRMALGGVRDEAEIRGHRKTYIGSMPGKILQNMTKVGVKNPLFLLDEIDKMGQDFRGDPSSAMLEVLDPEQNNTFMDHYAEVEYDLSNVMFVATANSLDIPEPLLDRMEIIRLAGYTEQEKLDIALKHLVPKQIDINGLKKNEINITASAIKSIIQFYTREAGVRKLEQAISKICRKAVKEILTKRNINKISVTSKNIDNFLGVKIFDIGLATKKNQVGQVTGLAWTQVGGELLTIESVLLPGKGKITLTGKLGDVMKESIHTALSVVRSRAKKYNIMTDFYEHNDVHIHVPEGATPKDGPSAGIGMTTAIISSLTHIPVRADVAMTGEITLRGEVLPIGGLKEKLLAAHRGGIKKVLIPEQNVKDLVDIPKEILKQIKVVSVKWIDQVIEHALTKNPENLKQLEKKSTKKRTDSDRKLDDIDKSVAH
ncbi:MAG: endopeptidase La [Nitrosomonadales bacterium]